MSLYGVLRTSVSGMNAQSNKLGTVSDNIANSSTTGYKRASTEFSSLLLENQGTGSYNSGSVETKVRYAISDEGTRTYTTSSTDLAIGGDGFFIVADQNGTGAPVLTRAGSFVKDGATGNLVNAAGFTLLGYNLTDGSAGVINGTQGLVPVNMSSMNMMAEPTSSGAFSANLPDGDAVGATKTSSVVMYDNLGNEVLTKVEFTKTAAADATATPPTGAQWTMTLTANGTTTTQNLEFNSSGQLTTPNPATTSVEILNGNNVSVDISGLTALAGDYQPSAPFDGSPPQSVEDTVIDPDGVVYAVYEDGSRKAAFRIPLATVASPDNLQPMAGNVFTTTNDSGGIQIGTAETGAYGSIVSGALESSNVDIANELTEMIIAQRDYTANSKSFQTGTELLDVLMNLKR
ncbi:flagellar hook protein FlgE [Pseudoxanthobacter soli DSM 19599]|uniref:Flagellar hook protein FlgE n=1 Tax=Pseudoxanthobacter soli DSM 19599 TaxID=1123029 RepID=A0A1M7ZEC0_9HYPH|nr:flagellar hook protein FlgE [Pseudoxanthobacter soli]SHO63227.1 flagellar hook protein FlgE [Pseudoxanthobacter soli DSM 19599]